jgi:hypothetical protein
MTDVCVQLCDQVLHLQLCLVPHAPLPISTLKLSLLFLARRVTPANAVTTSANIINKQPKTEYQNRDLWK